MNEESYQRFLKAVLEKQAESPKGLRLHMEKVAEMAVDYAKEVHYSIGSARLAGLAHDLFRTAPSEEIYYWAAFSNFKLSKSMEKIPMLAHGPAAAGWLMKNLPELGMDIVLAVRDHTFPPKDPPMLTKILAVADCLEPSREISEREEIRLKKISFEERFVEVMKLKSLLTQRRGSDNLGTN